MAAPDFLSVLSRAVDDAREGITIADASRPDYPIIYVNQGFVRMTGYQPEEAVGRNLRFLQGPETDSGTLRRVHEAIGQQQHIQTELLNYRKDGSTFWNRMSITPVFDERGKLTHYIGVQDDITFEKQKEEAEASILRQRLITETTLAAVEKERREMGRELHDNINQLLASSKLMLHVALSQEDTKNDLIRQSIGLLNKTVEEIRKLSRSLVGPTFGEHSLHAALQELVENLELIVPFAIELETEAFDESMLSDARKLMIYRVVQEQLNNIIKHARADRVTLRLQQSGAVLSLTITDNGRGFNTQQPTQGIGLKNMANRIELEQGMMQLISAPKKGCVLLVEVPLNEPLTS